MIKTLSQALRMDKERFKVPKSVQQAIPIQRIWPDGIFQQGTKFSKTYRFTDINYYIASKDNKTEMFLDYSDWIPAFLPKLPSITGESIKKNLKNQSCFQ